jgi:L-seryl-tRNA(Ser) seleniumtransferase
MNITENQQALLRKIPGVDSILDVAKTDTFFDNVPKSVLVRSIRSVVEQLRTLILDDQQAITEAELSNSSVLDNIKKSVRKMMTPNLIRIINATGVVIHTNLGRSLLADDAIENLLTIAKRYSNLEFDLSKGTRGSRYSIVEDILRGIRHGGQQ